MAAGETRRALRDVSLFRSLPEKEIETLAGQVVERRFGRNELIFSQGDRGDGLYVVTEGHVSISRQGADGDELILAVYEPGEYFGELALFDEEPRSANAIAIEETTALFLSRSGFRAFLQAHPSAVVTCLEVIVGLLRRCTDLADEIALLDVRSRLAKRLLQLSKQGMVEGSDNGQTRKASAFRITQQQLASMVGNTRESVNKHLNALAQEGLLSLDRGHVRILDFQRLEECSEGLL